MDLNLRMLIRIGGILFLVMGCTMFLPIAVGLYYKEIASACAFLYVAIPSLLAGLLILKLVHTKNKSMKIRDGILVVSLSWFFCALLGCLPFIISGSIPHPIDAFFETCSGFSTTGFSIIDNVEILPKSTLFWRSFTHWLGGMGILVFAVALLPALGISGQTIASFEAPGPILSKLTPKMSDTARMLYILYFSFTILETILLMLGGMSLFDAVCHSFSTLGTGGFGNYNNSIAHFDSPYIDGVISLFMFMSSINFNLYFILFTKGLFSMFRDEELRLYTGVTVTTISLIVISLSFSGGMRIFKAIRYAVFQLMSLLSTTGFKTYDYSLWPTFAQMLLLLVFFIGGCSSSTGGGIKAIRILVLLKLVKRSIALRLHPRAVINVKINGELATTDTVSNIANFLFLYITLILMGAFAVSFDGYDIMTNFSVAASCLGNIGQGFGELTSASSLDFFSYPSKLILSFLMIAGRLEVFPLFMLFSKKFWKPY